MTDGGGRFGNGFLEIGPLLAVARGDEPTAGDVLTTMLRSELQDLAPTEPETAD